MQDGADDTAGVGAVQRSARLGPVTAAMLIQDVLLAYPETRAVFAAWRLPCSRCLASGYETVGQLAVTIGLDGHAFMADLNRAIAEVSPDAWRWPHAGPTTPN